MGDYTNPTKVKARSLQKEVNREKLPEEHIIDVDGILHHCYQAKLFSLLVNEVNVLVLILRDFKNKPDFNYHHISIRGKDRVPCVRMHPAEYSLHRSDFSGFLPPLLAG